MIAFIYPQYVTAETWMTLTTLKAHNSTMLLYFNKIKNVLKTNFIFKAKCYS